MQNTCNSNQIRRKAIKCLNSDSCFQADSFVDSTVPAGLHDWAHQLTISGNRWGSMRPATISSIVAPQHMAFTMDQ